MQIFILIATIGRPDVVGQQLDHLRGQRRLPDHIVLCPASDDDLPAGVSAGSAAGNVHVRFGALGLCAQRNLGIRFIFDDLGATDDDLIAAIDDDFVLRDDWIDACAALFASDPELAAATGVLLEDGARNAGVSFEDAVELLRGGRSLLPSDDWRRVSGRVDALYGCNMVFRAAVVRDLAFDENLPLYGWLEDADISGQIHPRALARTETLVGVHMGLKSGRVSGYRFGYSQVANNLYLMRKGTLGRRLGWKLVRDCVGMNAARSLRPEPWIDRRGRFCGNLEAIRDAAVGRAHPSNILSN